MRESMWTLKGSNRKAQGASPGYRRKAKDQPCKGGTVCAALTGLFSRILMIPVLAPWAFLFRPFGARYCLNHRRFWNRPVSIVY